MKSLVCRKVHNTINHLTAVQGWLELAELEQEDNRYAPRTKNAAEFLRDARKCTTLAVEEVKILAVLVKDCTCDFTTQASAAAAI